MKTVAPSKPKVEENKNEKENEPEIIQYQFEWEYFDNFFKILKRIDFSNLFTLMFTISNNHDDPYI